MWGKKVTVRKADTIFSQYIRQKAGWKCEYCGKDFSGDPQRLHCSHYYGRGKESTRFEEDNCLALCVYHHHYLGHGDGRDEYRDLMIKKLGQKRFDSLLIQSNTYQKRDDKIAFLIAQQLLSSLK